MAFLPLNVNSVLQRASLRQSTWHGGVEHTFVCQDSWLVVNGEDPWHFAGKGVQQCTLTLTA